MLEDTLRELNAAVEELDTAESLSILNIHAELLHSPGTTLEYLARCRAWNRLRNIARSIPDLLNQSDRIALVGFLGHFSSGKSSLINALLGIANDENPGYKRDVGLHPTDSGITLITHRDHAKLVRKSGYTAIDSVEVVHGPASRFLEHATLVDTPGLGNEVAEHEAVARFLHLCHVLVITIDGRRPFADKDKDFELLDTAFNKLSGVPKLLVVTSAEEFLTSRTASFATGWQSQQAEAFWDEAIERLRRDPRFRDHLDRFEKVPRFFVDSKEGFRIEQVRESVLPIVTDDAHRSRIRQAQGRYVLATAAEALGVLQNYISTRSNNLNRLRAEAQQRADGTATAVEELLESLDSSFASVRRRLQESREGLPTGTFAVETIVTAQAVKETQSSIIRKLEGEIRTNLEQQLGEARKSAWWRVRRHCRTRTRGWFPTNDGVDVTALLDCQVDTKGDGTGLATAARTCARDMLGRVHQQYTASFVDAARHLQSAGEAWEIGSRTHDIELSLERFQIKHDDSVRSFYAYISAPSSSELLREHGFVGFDASGEQAVRTQSIDALACPGFVAIRRAAENCKGRLGLLRQEEPHDLEESKDAGGQWGFEEAALGGSYYDQVASRVNEVCGQRVGEFVAQVSGHIDSFVEGVKEERSHFSRLRGRIWKARGALVARSAAVVSLLSIAIFAVAKGAPSHFAYLLSMLSDRLLEAVFVGVLSTLVVLVFVYVVSGAKNENLRQALRSVILERLASGARRRGLAATLKTQFDESYDVLVSDIAEMPLRADQAIAEGIVKWLKSYAEAFQKAEQALADFRRLIAARCEVLDEFIGVFNHHLNAIPKELRDTAGEVKKHAIEEHMSRIQAAASSVEAVRLDVERAASVAGRSH